MDEMRRGVLLFSAVALVIFLAGSLQLARLENGGPAHADLMLAGGIPATVFLPIEGGREAARRHFLEPPPRAARPPAVVAMHGFAGDRASLSGLCRGLARSGYAVLAFDAMGHGGNRNPFNRGAATADDFAEEFAAAVDFLRTWPFVDGEHIAVLGHSMGASAALDYASRDAGIDAAVLISGGARVEGPYRPANALFLYASGDPRRIRERSAATAARLAGVEELAEGTTHGDPALRNAVRLVSVRGADHQGVVWMEKTLAETLGWLDASFAVEVTRGAVPGDPRVGVALLLALAFAGLLPGLGFVVAALVPRTAPLPSENRGLALVGVALACAAISPLLAVSTPAPILSAEVVDRLVPHFALAGLALLTLVWLRRPGILRDSFERPGAVFLGAALGVMALYVCLVPLGVVLHRVTLTPERMLVYALCFVGFLPFHFAFNLLLRRGPVASATLYALLGRLLVLGVLMAAVPLAGLDRVILLMLPALTLVSILFEAFASALYAGSRNILAIALVEAGWLALVVAAIMPVRL
ncbi:MAG: alpha/beta fold hydrolase [Deltaproteobacteria bacterium]|nr:alpha/beta fold hydrolase [Deltaproteobacteria bacterium]